MKYLLFLILLVVGCEQPEPYVELPTINVPLEARQKNYAGGSCVHASLISLMRWQGREQLADSWQKKYKGGDDPYNLPKKLDAENIKYAQTEEGSESFLDWACSTRRGAAVTFGQAHMICLVYLDKDWACVLDNNNVSEYQWVPRKDFIKKWHEFYGKGWAVTIVDTPAAPIPY